MKARSTSRHHPVAGTPAEFGQHIAEGKPKVGEVVKFSGAKSE